MKSKRLKPEFVYQGDKPTAVILDIKVYREMLERLEDAEDLDFLKRLRKKPLKFRPLETIMNPKFK